MAAPIVITAKTDEEFRTQIARQALFDMHFLFDTLRREGPGRRAELDDEEKLRFEALWPVLSDRICELRNAALSAIDDANESTQKLADIVFGHWLRPETEES